MKITAIYSSYCSNNGLVTTKHKSQPQVEVLLKYLVEIVINLYDLGGCEKLLNKNYKVENLIEFPGH